MNDVEQQQLAIRFANFLRAIPHRTYCTRSAESAKNLRCSCDIGHASLKVFNKFTELLELVGENNP
jgi:hypothetical protein